MNQFLEAVVFWGALLAGLVVYAIIGRHLMREIRRGKTSRFVAVVVYGVSTPLLSVLPVLIACSARWVGNLAGFSIFPKESADDGVMVGIGFIGMGISMGAAVLFAVVMIFQALTGAGESQFDAKN